LKILILALSGIGDALMFTPAINLLRRELPEAQIDALVMFKGVKDIYERNPHLSNVIFFEFMKEGAVNSLKFVMAMRGKYDAAINVYPANRREYNIINFLLGAKHRLGVEYIRMNRKNFGFLNNVSVKEDDSLHNVQENVNLIGKFLKKDFNDIPPLEFPLLDEDKLFAEKFLKNNTIKDEDIVIGFHPGCATLKNHIKRRWEPEKFAALAKQLIGTDNTTILLFGGPDEYELVQQIHNQVNDPKCFFIRTANLAQTAALMKRCNVFVSNDSSLMHISAAMQLNVVGIIGPTNTNYIHPWKTNYKIASLNLECAPCFFYSPIPLQCSRTDVQFKCIKELDVDRVYKAVKEFL